MSLCYFGFRSPVDIDVFICMSSSLPSHSPLSVFLVHKLDLNFVDKTRFIQDPKSRRLDSLQNQDDG